MNGGGEGLCVGLARLMHGVCCSLCVVLSGCLQFDIAGETMHEVTVCFRRTMWMDEARVKIERRSVGTRPLQ
jgi:hypothetical protein